MSWWLRACLAIAIAAQPLIACAEDYAGRIVGVVDGDTVDLLTANKALIRVRLAGIDAPEKGQPFGHMAKVILSSLVFHHQVVVSAHKKDRYGRLVGKVSVAGVDANLQMVRRGYAWHYKRYESEQSAQDRDVYARAEVSARSARVGIWTQPDPVAPWDYRLAQKK